MFERINPQKLFLIDSLGALLSAFLLGFVLVWINEYIGMPHRVLSYLATLAGMFCLYSFICFYRFPANWRTLMKIIAIVNLSYCVLSMTLVIYFFDQLTALGVTYFIGEKVIVIALATTELKTAIKQVKFQES